MRIILIKPNMRGSEFNRYTPADRMQPLAIAVLAGLTPPEHEVMFYDDRMEKIPYDKPADLVGITVETFTAKRAYEISREFRGRGVPVVLGGFHPTLIPEEAAEYADAVVIGEAEGVWEEVLDDAKNKKLRKFYKSSARPHLSGVIPRRDIFKGKKYLPLTLVEFGRGCKYSCEFCAISSFYGNDYVHRPAEEVVEEIKNINKKMIFFTDDNIAANPGEAKKLFKLLTPLKIRWAAQISIDFAADEELLNLMKKSGCYCLIIGFESLNVKNLTQMGKIRNIEAGDYNVILKKIRNLGIKIYAAFIFGYDYDDKKSFDNVLNFALSNKFFVANFNHLMPYPNTPLYHRLSEESRLLYKKWWVDEHYCFGHAVFRPKHISADELTEGCINAKLKFNSFTGVIKRGSDFKANCRNFREMIEFFTYSALIRKEIIKKQNMRLAGVSPQITKEG